MAKKKSSRVPVSSIDLGVQSIPPRKRGRGAPSLYALDTLRIGECRLIRNKSYGAVCAAVWRYQQRFVERFIVRSVLVKNRTVVKIWRIS